VKVIVFMIFFAKIWRKSLQFFLTVQQFAHKNKHSQGKLHFYAYGVIGGHNIGPSAVDVE
jgi:hypothetical protein